MAFDQATRGRLQRFVNDARRVLEEEFTRQLQNDYGMDPNAGTVADLASLRHINDAQCEIARILRDTLAHYTASGDMNASQALDRIVREQAFTVLNRLAALRMAEARGLLVESVGNGFQAKGIQLYARLAGTGLGETGDAYRVYLFSVFDELAQDLPGLFDRYSPQGRLFPREAALLQVLNLINDNDIAPLWSEDETIGWIYQYFNSKEERKAMREASQAPRNSRELAVRNQFFTPRYVVEFLVDNTLGRMWFNATGGATHLRDRCQYLLVKLHEAPQPATKLRDPRTLKLLDPACGSMHFGLYAFDLFAEIYREAWAWEQQHGPGSLDVSTQLQAAFKPLTQTYGDQAAFLRDVPRLIIEHNLYGVDIDPRAAQIASLALWLRAQRAWHDAGVKAKDRPLIGTGHVVAAIAPPAERDLQQQFAANLDHRDAELFEKTLELLKGLPELGVLLQVERELPQLVQKVYVGKGTDLFATQEQESWRQAEARLRTALTEFAISAKSKYQGRLFAQDALQGLRLIDFCRHTYDVVVMNPPFGEATPLALEYASKKYKRSKSDVLCMFIERAASLLSKDGRCAAITNRTPFFTDGTEAWRDAFFLGEDHTELELFADLGHKVLDSALVETSAYVISKAEARSLFHWINVTQVQDKESALREKVKQAPNVASIADIRTIPGHRLSYWLPKDAISSYRLLPSLADSVEAVDKGMSTTDDFRFVRAFWEVPSGASTTGWMYYSKGGEYSPFASDIHLVVNWREGGREISELVVAKYPYLNGESGWVLHPETHHGHPGLTYTKRTTSSFSARFLRPGARVSDLGNLVFDTDIDKLLGALVCLSTSPFHYLLDAAVPSIDSSAGGTAARHYEVGTLREVPVPVERLANHAEAGRKLHGFAQSRFISDETALYFSGFTGVASYKSLAEGARCELITNLEEGLKAIEIHAREEAEFISEYGLSAEAEEAVYEYMGPHPSSLPQGQLVSLLDCSDAWGQSEEILTGLLISQYGGKRRFSKQTWVGDKRLELWSFISNKSPRDVVAALKASPSFLASNSADYSRRICSYLLGSAFGRWDIRHSLAKEPLVAHADPTSPLPPCSAAQLRKQDGTPILKRHAAEIQQLHVDGYPFNVNWAGILVDEPGHPLDIERQIQGVIGLIWPDKVDFIEDELCELLEVKSLREFFRKPSGFFLDHLKRYSKSRRSAPIYWPLSTSSGLYTLWIYYPALDSETLFTAINDFIEPKLRRVANDAMELRNKGTARGRDDERRLEELQSLQLDLIEFRDSVLKIAPTYRPNSDDGVEVSASPLWQFFRHKPWQKVLKDTWTKLQKGDYDWAHLAMNYWPERVREKCRTDKSLSIAHGLEHLYVEPEAQPKKTRGRKKAGGDE